LAKELTNIALGDSETAEWLLSVRRFRWGLIALQQSLEKAIKAILLSHVLSILASSNYTMHRQLGEEDRPRKDRSLSDPEAAGGAPSSGSSTTSTEPAYNPRCLSRRTFRRRYGKVAEALCPYTPYGQRRAGACVLSYILPAMTSSSAAGSVVKNCC